MLAALLLFWVLSILVPAGFYLLGRFIQDEQARERWHRLMWLALLFCWGWALLRLA